MIIAKLSHSAHIVITFLTHNHHIIIKLSSNNHLHNHPRIITIWSHFAKLSAPHKASFMDASKHVPKHDTCNGPHGDKAHHKAATHTVVKTFAWPWSAGIRPGIPSKLLKFHDVHEIIGPELAKTDLFIWFDSKLTSRWSSDYKKRFVNANFLIRIQPRLFGNLEPDDLTKY